MIKSENINLNCQIKSSSDAKLSIIFLHGFTGSSNDWLPFFNQLSKQIQIIAIDLPGHGKNYSSAIPDLYTTEYIIRGINSIIKNLCVGKVVLAGYSMGGRVALTYTCKFPKNISGLILESTTAGIVDSLEREQRIESDLMLAEFIEVNPIYKFVDYWLNLPLFDSQKRLEKITKDEIRQAKLFNSPLGLANSLRGFGTGFMPNLWNDLGKILCPTLLLTGELDEKFTAINERMNKKIKDSTHIIVEECGHNIHLERPEVFVSLVNGFTDQIL